MFDGVLCFVNSFNSVTAGLVNCFGKFVSVLGARVRLVGIKYPEATALFFVLICLHFFISAKPAFRKKKDAAYF